MAAGLALVAGACSAAPQLNDSAPAGRLPADSSPTTAPTTTTPAPPTTTAPAAPSGPLSFAATTTTASIGGCQLFPPDHFLNARNVDRLPVHPRSAEWTAFLARNGQKLNVPSSTIYKGARGGMPINVVDSRQVQKSPVLLDQSWTDHNYLGLYPIPSSPRLEGYPSAQWDRHLLMVDVADCTAYELIQYDPLLGSLGLHSALSGVRYRLDTTDRPRITTNAADTPMIGQYAMADEVRSGRVDHVLGFCTTDLGSAHIWPARKSDGKLGTDAPPMGAWLRLRGDVDLGRFTGQARTIAEALRDHGMVLTDTCGHQLNLLAENSGAWNDNETNQLGSLSATDFEVVDPTPMMRAETSFRVN